MKVVTKSNIETISGSKPQVEIILERCAGCQECVMRCPTQALFMDVTSWKAAVHNELCVGCRQCERTCPFSAISVSGPRLVAERVELPAYRDIAAGDENREARPGFASLEDAVKEAQRCLNCPDPTCVRGCPAHNDIPRFIEAVRNRDLPLAREILSRTSCLPDVCSRVCDWKSQCEGSCSWALAGGQAVAIGKLERFVSDNTKSPLIASISTGGKGLSVAIVGSGPAGIAAAWELVSSGAQVAIYEQGPVPGGVLHWGIPSYILPDEVAQRPVQALVEAGVKFYTNNPVSPEIIQNLLSIHDAVISAQGASVPERPNIPGEDLDGVMDATAFLTRAKQALSEGRSLAEVHGATILVLGGSDTAIDVARSIVRLGGKAVIIHRREERFSRARPDEIAEARKEGVEFHFATNIARLEGHNGRLESAVLVSTHQKRADGQAEVIKGSEHEFKVNAVVLATGYKIDPGFSSFFSRLPVRQPSSERLLPDRRWTGSGILSGSRKVGRLAWEREYGLRFAALPRRDKLWLVGDALVGPSTVGGSMAQGRQAARGVLESQTRK